MATENVLRPLEADIDRSPVCKRARYDFETSSDERWTLSRNELVLHSVYDSGLGRLSDADFDLDIEEKPKHKKPRLGPPVETPSKSEQIAVLEASLPENTLQKLTLGELDSMLIKPNLESNPNNTGINYFDYLSDEVMLHIFQKLSKCHLSNVALVCRRFSQLSEDESLWTRMDVSNRTLENGSVGVILSRQVIVLRLARSRILAPPILPHVRAAEPDYRSRLMYLDLTMAAVSPKSLVAILEKCKRLRKLSLESVPINDSVLIAVAENRDIEVLNLAMATGWTAAGLKILLKSCRKIRELNLSWTYPSSESIETLCDGLPAPLERFNFSGCRKLLEDENVAQLVARCPLLRELDLSDCTSITGDSVKKLLVLEELNFLALSRCYLVPYRSLLFLKKMKSLVYLDVHGSYINSDEFKVIKDGLGVNLNINKFKFSSIARPTVGINRSSIWNMRVRD